MLLVEDDMDTLDLLSAALKHQKATVTAVTSAAEALASIRTSIPDIVVSDIAMPGKDGYQLIEKIQAMGCDGDRHPGHSRPTRKRKIVREPIRLPQLSRQTNELSELVSAVMESVR